MKRPAPTKIAVFASGRGSNFDAIQAAIAGGRLNAEIVALVCDQPQAEVLEKAGKLGIATLLVPVPKAVPGEDPTARRERHEQEILAGLSAYQPRFLVLAGYMRILTSRLLEAFRDPRGYSRIVNVHPSLLPAFPGVDSYAQAFAHGCHQTGVTVHLVELEVDSGPICAQQAFSIGDCASARDVEARGLAIEHQLYPATLAWLLAERFEVESRQRRLFVRPN